MCGINRIARKDTTLPRFEEIARKKQGVLSHENYRYAAYEVFKSL